MSKFSSPLATDEITVFVENWIARRLQRPDLFHGDTTPQERRERVRSLILERDMAEAIAGNAGTPKVETWRQLFERVWKQPL